jgi:hypothetical protein
MTVELQPALTALLGPTNQAFQPPLGGHLMLTRSLGLVSSSWRLDLAILDWTSLPQQALMALRGPISRAFLLRGGLLITMPEQQYGVDRGSA